jgi:pyruvate dehydrogenase kinase 2/3/4
MVLNRALKKYYRKPVTPMMINSLYYWGKNVYKENMTSQSTFLKEELSIRMAHRVFDLLRLPFGLPILPEVKGVIDLYCKSFDRIQSFGTINKDYDVKLFNPALDRFFLSRISIRTLIAHQVSTCKNSQPIIKMCNLKEIVSDVKEILDINTNRVYDVEIPLEIEGRNIDFLYIPGHLHYILLEILKNSSVAHIENGVKDPVRLTISEGSSDVILRISDKGGGFCLQDIEKVLTYSYTTTKTTDPYNSLSGFGFGLPLSRAYAQYFGGKLQINPIEGVGTDIFVYLNKLGDENERMEF